MAGSYRKIIISLLIAFLIMPLSKPIFAEDDKNTKITKEEAGKEKFQKINYNQIISLNGMNMEEINDFRIDKVKEYSFLKIFPDDYKPDNRIYGQITPGADWVEGAQYYICNPYKLIVCSSANHVTPLAFYSSPSEITYYNNAVVEIYEGDEARYWFRSLEADLIRLWMQNAYDAGFIYASIDQEKSKNINLSFGLPQNITKSVYSNSCFYHVGRYKKNNLSPADANGRIKLIDKYQDTYIYVKLWKEKPVSTAQKEDFAYVITIAP